MKILHLAPYSPFPPIFGGALRIYHILRGLSRRHDVTFATFGYPHEREQLETEFGRIVREIRVVEPDRLIFRYPWWRMVRALTSGQSFYTQFTNGTSMQETLDELYTRDRYDITLLEFPHVGKFRFPNNTLVVLDEHNIEYSNFERMYKGVRSPARKLLYLREQHKTYAEEVAVCRRVDGIFATSSRDLDIIEHEVPNKPKFVIPNGVDVEYFVPANVEVEPCSMVYTGTMDYVPNQNAMLYFLDEIFPLIKNVLPQAKLYIVGKNPPNALKRRSAHDVIVTGFVEDVRPFAWKAAVYVVPLRMGGGTRLKILEGLAMKKPVVTTSIGCEGLDVRDGQHVIVADDPGTFAARVVDLLMNREKAQTLGAAGFDLVKSKYDWEVVIASMDKALTSLVNEAHRSESTHIVSSHVKSGAQSVPEGRADRNGLVPRIKVLMYHRVVDDSDFSTSSSWSITQSQLRRHLALLLAWGYAFISFQDYLSFQRGEAALPSRAVILTFDDGYEGVYRHALPVIQEFGAKATAFVLGDRSIRSNVWDQMDGDSHVRLMEDHEILELHRCGFEIGSHSMVHPNLTRLHTRKAWEEVVRSKEILERLVHAPVISFAYPYGASNTDIENMVCRAGYYYACGVFSGPPHFASNQYDIRRIPVKRNTGDLQFALRMLTPYEYYLWLRWETGRKLGAGKNPGKGAIAHQATAYTTTPISDVSVPISIRHDKG